MTLPAVIRIFFAIDLPPDVKKQIYQTIKQLKKKSKSNGIRWTKEENLHITLQFLAEIRSDDLATLVMRARGFLDQNAQSCIITCRGLHLFPNPYRPRVIVLDIHPQSHLATIASAIAQGISACAYPTETRRFRAHLTLGRIKQPHEVNLNFLHDSQLPPIDAISVQEVVLFRSEPEDHGSKYSVLERIALN